jgi:hypothetical protein
MQIASPCLANWSDMVGDDRSRHCLACNKTVYDLSGLTAQQALALIREKDGELCVRLFRRADGRVLTADCPVGLRARLMRAGQRIGLAAWVLLGSIAGLFGCGFLLLTNEVTKPQGGLAVPPGGRGVQPFGGPERREMGKLECKPDRNDKVDD